MKDYKKIDRLFQEKFRDFEQKPSPHVWDNISGALTGKPKKDRRVFWLWFSSAAAGLAILFSINNPFITTNDIKQNTSDTNDVNNSIISNPETEITNTSTKEINTNSNIITNPNTSALSKTTPQKTNKIIIENQLKTDESYIASENILNERNAVFNPNNSQTNKLLAKQNKDIAKQSNEPIIKPLDKNPLQSNESSLADNSNSNNIVKQSLNAINNDDSKSEELVSTNKSNKKWILSTLAAPILMSAFDKGVSSIDAQFNGNSKQGQISASYGVQLAYQVSNRFIVQSGLHKVAYGYKTNDVFVSPDRYAGVYSNINYDDNINLIEISPSPSSDSDLTSEETRLIESEGSLTQVFGYYEIPLEAKYAIKKGNFGVNVLGGFSTLILNKNEIFVQTDEFSNKIGEATNLNRVNLTGNLGIELDYKILQNVHFNVTPMIKVHANTFEKNTNGFSPYAIGVYSGLNFRF